MLTDDELYAAIERGKALYVRYQSGPRGMTIQPTDDVTYCIALSVARAALAAAPQGEPVAFHELLREAEAEVREKPVWKRHIDGTPLANDVPVWMAVFAQHHARAAHPPRPDALLTAARDALALLRAAQAEHVADEFPVSNKVADAQDALRRALDTGDGAGEAQDSGQEARKP